MCLKGNDNPQIFFVDFFYNKYILFRAAGGTP